MGTSIVDGTIESIEAGRRNKKVAVFKTIVFRENGGETRTVKKAVVTGPLMDEIAPGNSGRFYLFTAFDIKGVHGLRKSDGTAIYDYPGKTNVKIFLYAVIASALLIALRLAIGDGVPLLSVLLIVFGSVGWYLTSKSARETRRQFDEDAALTATA
jgi:hypothetical protein